MNWTEYREALGIGFSDKQKEKLFRNRLIVITDTCLAFDCISYKEDRVCKSFFYSIYEIPDYGTYDVNAVRTCLFKEAPFLETLGKAIVLANTIKRICNESWLFSGLSSALDDLRIPYEIVTDNDGVFIFPKGAKELDEANISIPFEWLKAYPTARNAMSTALRAYSNKDNPSNTADLFRKALEAFCQEFLGSEKSLENLKSELGLFLKEIEIPQPLVSNFETTLQMYTNYMNSYAKHHDKTSEKYLEFIMYQTGNIIRFILSLAE